MLVLQMLTIVSSLLRYKRYIMHRKESKTYDMDKLHRFRDI